MDLEINKSAWKYFVISEMKYWGERKNMTFTKRLLYAYYEYTASVSILFYCYSEHINVQTKDKWQSLKN